MRAGDTAKCEIEGIGALNNPVVGGIDGVDAVGMITNHGDTEITEQLFRLRVLRASVVRG